MQVKERVVTHCLFTSLKDAQEDSFNSAFPNRALKYLIHKHLI